MGRVLSCEKPKSGRRPGGRKGKARSRRARTRVRREPRVVEDPWHARKLHAREPGDLRTDCLRKRSSPAREGRKPYDWRERNGGVGLCRSTSEPAEQRRTDERWFECGGWGGKGTDRGEHQSDPHEPDTGREETRVPGAGGCAPSSESKERGAVHCLTPPSHARASARQFLRIKAGGCGRGRRGQMGRV